MPSSGNVIVAITPAVVTIVFSGAATYDLTMYTVGEGTVNPGNQSNVAQGTNFDLEAMPADGWAFSGWSNDSSGHSNTTISMDADKVVTATFIPTYNLTMNIYVDEILLDTEMDTFNAGYVRNGYVNLDALLPESTFDHLRIDDTNVTGTTFSITMDQNHVLEAFLTTTQLQLNLTSAIGGTTDLAEGTHIYSYGSTVNITATPAEGYLFSHWIVGEGTNQTNPMMLTVTENVTITPVFTVDPNYVPPTYNVTFSQTGLPSGTSWTVTFNGTTQTTTTDTITFTGCLEGAYDYSIAIPNGYTSNATLTGTLSIEDNVSFEIQTTQQTASTTPTPTPTATSTPRPSPSPTSAPTAPTNTATPTSEPTTAPQTSSVITDVFLSVLGVLILMGLVVFGLYTRRKNSQPKLNSTEGI